MFRIVRLRVGAVAAAILVLATAAGATTINGINLTVDPFNRGKLAQAQQDRDNYLASHRFDNLHVETFEGFQPWGVGRGTQNLTRTAVGSFKPYGRTGSGNSVVGKGTKLQVRDDNHMKWGRYNSSNTPALPPGLADGNWLDSNDNRGIKWRIKGVGPFNAIGFFVIDAADVGGKFSIKIGKTLFSDLADGMRLKNGNIHFISILLPQAVDRLTIRLSHNIHNDGFGVDGAIVGQISPVPLPPAAALLLPAVGLLAGLRRRARRGAAPA